MADLIGPTAATELLLLGLAFALSLAIGVERSRKSKSAGLRTHVLVGLGSALFTLVSAYGFQSVVDAGAVLDPSRIAAQIVSGIGFLGAGVIFVRNSTVNGLTTAASIWMTAAIGMACGAEMPLVAVVGTALHLLTVGPLSRLRDRVRPEAPRIRLALTYPGGGGTLRLVETAAGDYGFAATLLSVNRVRPDATAVEAVLEFRAAPGAGSSTLLVGALATLDQVQAIEVRGGVHEEG